MIYLDNAATTRPYYFARDYYNDNYWGNPNSPHKVGAMFHNRLLKAEESIKESLGVKSGHVFFCRGTSEAFDWIGQKLFHLKMYCSPYEHDCVIRNSWGTVKNPFQFTHINDDEVSFMYAHQYVNHITGRVFNIEEKARWVKDFTFGHPVFFVSDITAAIGHYPLPNNLEEYCDMLAFSGHKFNIEAGIGGFWISDRLYNHLGGNEELEDFEIHGTPNVAGAEALAAGMKFAVDNVNDYNTSYLAMMEMATKCFEENGVGARLLDFNIKKTGAINAFILDDIYANPLIQYLSSKDIYISPGHSACSANEDYRILEAMGLSNDEAKRTIRVSFCGDTRFKEVKTMIEEIKNFKEQYC